MSGIDNQPAGTHEEMTERQLRAFEFRKAGMSYRQIGRNLGVSATTALNDVRAVLAELAEHRLGAAAEYVALELERLDQLTLEAARVLQATHPYISGGKVLSGFTDDGKPIGLTDDGPKLQAIDRLLRISESRRKLLGLDAQPGTVPIGTLDITLRWHDDNRRLIDATPIDDHASPAPQITADSSAAPGALPYRVRWSEMGQEQTSSDAEPENSA